MLAVALAFTFLVALVGCGGDGRRTVETAPCSLHGFQAPAESPFAAGRRPDAVAIGDYNGDGRVDIAVGNAWSEQARNEYSTRFRVLLGRGNGTFRLVRSSFPAASYPISLASGDLNGDKRSDLVIANRMSSSVSVLLGQRQEILQPAPGSPVSIPIPEDRKLPKDDVAAGPDQVALTDVNGDGRLDLFAASFWSERISVFLGDGDGRFTSAPSSPVKAFPPTPFSLGNFDGDRKIDIAISVADEGTVLVLSGDGRGGFREQLPLAMLGGLNFGISSGDFDRDGGLDLATAGEDGHVHVLLGNGEGAFSEAAGSPYLGGEMLTDISVADFNDDGNPDIASVSPYARAVFVLVGDGHGRFTVAPQSPYRVGALSESLTTGDVNDDGRPDIVVANANSNTVSVLLNRCD